MIGIVEEILLARHSAGKVNATDTTSDGDFFATLINDWQPEADQSDYTQGYTASDVYKRQSQNSEEDQYQSDFKPDTTVLPSNKEARF